MGVRNSKPIPNKSGQISNLLRVGAISGSMKKRGIFLLALQFILILSALSYVRWQDSSAGCISCHSNQARMQALGYPYFHVTPEQVKKESRHTTAQCRDCHLGNGRIQDINKAHKGMLKMIVVGENGEILPRKQYYLGSLKPEGENQLDLMLPKIKIAGRNLVSADVRNILYHDRNIETLNYDPDISKKTCGQKNCHPAEVGQFSRTIMGMNFRQRTMKTWLVPYGPHNCGPSFADMPAADKIIQSRFSFENYNEIVKELNTDFTKEQAVAKQKFCNVCHTGCLDCHYTPFKGEGAHSFSRTPLAQNCAGGGRGSTMCHTGSGESRRGSSYLGGDFSKPAGMEADIHAKKLNCVDCHSTGTKGMGDMQRRTGCQDCHIEIEEAISQGRHKRLQCITCHVNEARGYQLTHWGKGHVAGKQNPFKKFFYYGISSPPLIMKDQKAVWIPVKVMPHTVSSIKNPVAPSNKILFRWQNGGTSDSYAVLGTFDGLPSGNLHLAWLDIEKISHPYGRARPCESCHGNDGGAQNAFSTWEFFEDEGAEPFKGTYKIIADKNKLKVFDIKALTPIKLYPEGRLADFAPWYYLKDIWQVSGDFSIPGNGYKEQAKAYQEAVKRLNRLKSKMSEKEFKRLYLKTVHGY
ncbi:MAG: hypothetical protein HZC11_05915 [Nitrospirae bacterium]|nr:hypothetical protein [Nitrospirota bacterium]